MSPPKPNPSALILYQTEDGRTHLQVRLENQTVWLTQKLMAELFQKDIRTINEHIRNIFDERELEANSVIRNFRMTAADRKSYDTQHHNLEAKLKAELEFDKFDLARQKLEDSQADAEFVKQMDDLAKQTKELAQPKRKPKKK